MVRETALYPSGSYCWLVTCYFISWVHGGMRLAIKSHDMIILYKGMHLGGT